MSQVSGEGVRKACWVGFASRDFQGSRGFRNLKMVTATSMSAQLHKLVYLKGNALSFLPFDFFPAPSPLGTLSNTA